jgi:hypothetical protein
VDVSATNNVGSTWSSTQTIVPYGTPSAPTNPVLNTNSSTATATITPSWSGPADSGGGSVTYKWNFSQGSSASGSTTGTSGSSQSVGAGDYTFQVRACNQGGLCSGYVSATRHINPPPPSGHVYDAGFVGQNQTDKMYYHYLGLCVANLVAGTYNVTFFNDSQGAYKTLSLSLPANGCINTKSQGGTSTPTGISSDWFQIDVAGQFSTPRYNPWS